MSRKNWRGGDQLLLKNGRIHGYAKPEMEVGSGFSGRARVGPSSGRVSGLAFRREIGLSRAQSRAH